MFNVCVLYQGLENRQMEPFNMWAQIWITKSKTMKKRKNTNKDYFTWMTHCLLSRKVFSCKKNASSFLKKIK